MWSAFLIKRLAVALTASQIFTQNEVPRTHFDPEGDQTEVVRIMNAGCNRIIDDLGQEFPDFQKLNIDELLDNLIASLPAKAATSVDIQDVRSAYQLVCKDKWSDGDPDRVAALIHFYNEALKNLPDPTTLKTLRLPEIIQVLDSSGKSFTEIYPDSNRRRVISISQIPESVQKAFVAAEDKKFFEHHGVDERGLMRAAMSSLNGGHEGGSTITQQVVKNLLVGDDLTFERKMREMVVASQLERILDKKKILEIYLNLIFFGRASWGIEMASKTFFGKPVDQLNEVEAALLAGLPKGPNYYNPNLHPDRALARMNYVLGQMGANVAERLPKMIAYQSPRSRGGFYFLDELLRGLNSGQALEGLSGPPIVRSTLNISLQAAVDQTLQEGLAQYEMRMGRARFNNPEANLAAEVKENGGDWQEALNQAHLPAYDVRWPVGIVMPADRSGGGGARVGLADGRVLPLTSGGIELKKKLKVYDVVFVKPNSKTAELRSRPKVQGAALVMESGTGKVVAMAGGFSYALSQHNRAVHMIRQPGSAIKPVIYLAALNAGYQPNTLIMDAPVTLPPMSKGAPSWSPDNYDGGGGGLTTLRRALENSRNRVTARLLTAISSSPPQSLEIIRNTIKECGADSDPPKQYPIVLGALDVTMLDLVTCYATIANLGYRPQARFFEWVGDNSKHGHDFPGAAPTAVKAADGVAFYQLRGLLQGVLERGTANRFSKELTDVSGGEPLSHVLAVKTGTSQQANDTWVVGFTSNVTMAVWIGYENARRREKETLGRGATGASVAGPIFENVVRNVAAVYPLKAFGSAPAAIASKIVQVPVEVNSGRVTNVQRGYSMPSGVIMENMRADSRGYAVDTWQRLASYQQYTYGSTEDGDVDYWNSPYSGNPYYRQQPRYQQPQGFFPFFGDNSWGGPVEDPSQRYRRQPQRVDPDWGWRWNR